MRGKSLGRRLVTQFRLFPHVTVVDQLYKTLFLMLLQITFVQNSSKSVPVSLFLLRVLLQFDTSIFNRMDTLSVSLRSFSSLPLQLQEQPVLGSKFQALLNSLTLLSHTLLRPLTGAIVLDVPRRDATSSTIARVRGRSNLRLSNTADPLQWRGSAVCNNFPLEWQVRKHDVSKTVKRRPVIMLSIRTSSPALAERGSARTNGVHHDWPLVASAGARNTNLVIPPVHCRTLRVAKRASSPKHFMDRGIM